MEQEYTDSLSIFSKYSVLYNILPYYGYLHEWKSLLKQICTETKNIWSSNKNTFINWGMNYKKEICFTTKESYTDIPKNVELFNLKTTLFFKGLYADPFRLNVSNSWKFNNVILPLLSKLNNIYGIKISLEEDAKEIITFITEKEIEDITPSLLWTSLKTNSRKFTVKDGRDIWEYISDNIQFKIIVIKRWEDDIVVYSVIPNYLFSWDHHNILNKEAYENLKEYYSWPILDCIWKPKLLWINSDITSERECEFEDLNEEVTQQVLWTPLFESVKEIWIVRSVINLTSIENIFRIAEQHSHINVIAGVDYNYNKDFQNTWAIESRALILIFNGIELKFEGLSSSLLTWECHFNEIKLIDDGNLAIINPEDFYFDNVVATLSNDLNNKVQKSIDELKIETESNDDLFIIVDSNNMKFYLELEKLKKYYSILKYFKTICIKIECKNSDVKQKIIMLNNLPKEYKYEVSIKQSN